MTDRKYQIEYGVWIPADPDSMDRDTLIRTVEDLATFASTKLIENRALQNILTRHMERGGK